MENETKDVTPNLEPPKTQIAVRAPLEVDNGALVPKTATELSAMLTQVARGGGFPDRFDTSEKRLAAYNLAQSLMGPQWQLALNNIAIIKGQMCIWGEMPGTLAERTGEVQEKEVYLLDEKYTKICTSNKNVNATAFVAVCRIQRKGRVIKEFTYSMEEAEKAGQYPATKYDKETRSKVPNLDAPWMKFTKIMLMRKAMAMAIKFEFPEALVGVKIAEYDYDEAPDLRDVTPFSDEKQNRVQELNSRFAHAEEPALSQAQ